MTDVHTKVQRRRNMAAIRSRDTEPELRVRRALHREGLRYSLHRRDLPGCPDLVFRSRKKAILVHGCFWHMHSCRWGSVVPATRRQFWQEKRLANVQRDRRQLDALNGSGWSVFIAWECETRDMSSLTPRLLQFLRQS